MPKTRRQMITLIHHYGAALEARGIPVERVILFGSYVAGHPQEWSNIGIAVISPKFASMSLLERYAQLGVANRHLRTPLDIVGFTPSHVAHSESGSFLEGILKTGVDVTTRSPRATRKRQ